MSDQGIKIICISLIVIAIIITLGFILSLNPEGAGGVAGQLMLILVALSGSLATFLQAHVATNKAQEAVLASQENKEVIAKIASTAEDTNHNVEKVVQHTDGMKDALVKAVADASFQKGKEQGHIEEKQDVIIPSTHE